MTAQLMYEKRGETVFGKMRRYRRTMEIFVSAMMAW
jgi:hypothetical protein